MYYSSLLKLHNNIVDKSTNLNSNYKENDHTHSEEVLLFLFNNPVDNLLIQSKNIEYDLINRKQIQDIQINFLIKIEIYSTGKNILNLNDITVETKNREYSVK